MNNLKYIVSAQWLASQLTNPDIVIIDTRFRLQDPQWGYQEYLTNHIPNAYYLDLNQDLSAPLNPSKGGRHPLPNPELLSSKLSNMGIKKGETLVVIYDDSRFAFAARLWWLLRYYDHEQVAILDGGWQGWQKAGYPTTNRIPEAKIGNFKPQLQPDWVVDLETLQLRQQESGVVVIDSRESDRYLGKIEPIDPVAGHIPGALNSPWQQVTDDQGYLRPIETQKELWKPYTKEKQLIFYCGSGVTACVNLLSLAVVGITDVKLYPGGWSEYCQISAIKS